MKKIIAAVLASAFVLSTAASSAAAPEEGLGDVGSCYSAQPICMYPQHPVCSCDYSMRCFWVCL